MNRVFKKKCLKIDFFLLFFFLFLLVKSLFYNYIYDIAVWPDKDYHLAVSGIYKENPMKIFFWNPEDVQIECSDPVKYNPRVASSPFLYHSLVGKIWFLTGSLRLTCFIQTFLGLLTIYYVYFLALFVSKSKWVAYLSLVIIGNLPMFFYQINYISYDNLVNLAGVASIFYFIKYLNNGKIRNFICLLIFLMLGSLSKITFGPLLVIIFGFLLVFKGNKLILIIKDLISFVFDKRNWLLSFILLLLLALNLLFYGRNIVKYDSFFPKYSYELERDC